MHNMQVSSMLKGYCKHAAALGNQKTGVMPLTQPELHTVLSSVLEMLHMADTAQQQLLV